MSRRILASVIPNLAYSYLPGSPRAIDSQHALPRLVVVFESAHIFYSVIEMIGDERDRWLSL